MDQELMALVWDAYWEDGNTETALKRVVEVVRAYDKAAALKATSPKISKLNLRQQAA